MWPAVCRDENHADTHGTANLRHCQQSKALGEEEKREKEQEEGGGLVLARCLVC